MIFSRGRIIEISLIDPTFQIANSSRPISDTD
jgi:hypothetical protein